MREAYVKRTVASALACAVSACSGADLGTLQDLPVRTTPQAQTPYGEAAPGAPLRGDAVAVDLAVL